MRIHPAFPGRPILLTLLFLILSPLVAAAQGGPATTLDPVRITREVDPIFTDAVAKGEIPGAVFLLVQGNDVLLRKAYGYADPAKRIPMDADRTAIHICSVSKIFTAAAVMQLVEKGTLELDADVNRMLLGKLAPTPAELEPLGEHLERHMPPVIDPPGTVSRCSNYGMALAGYLVEVASGMPFETCVE